MDAEMMLAQALGALPTTETEKLAHSLERLSIEELEEVLRLEKTAETETERARRYGRTGAKIGLGTNIGFQLAGRAMGLKAPVAGRVAGAAIDTGLGYGIGRGVHRLRHGYAHAGKKVKEKRSSVKLAQAGAAPAMGIIPNAGKAIAAARPRSSMLRSATPVGPHHMPHVPAPAPATAPTPTGMSITASADLENLSIPELEAILRTESVRLKVAMADSWGRTLARASAGKEKVAIPLRAVTGIGLRGLAHRAAPMWGAGIGAGLGAARYALSDDPNKSLLGSMGVGAALGGGAAFGGQRLVRSLASTKGLGAMSWGEKGGTLGQKVRGMMREGGKEMRTMYPKAVPTPGAAPAGAAPAPAAPAPVAAAPAAPAAPVAAAGAAPALPPAAPPAAPPPATSVRHTPPPLPAKRPATPTPAPTFSRVLGG